MKTLRYDVENKYGTKLTPNHVMWSWFVRHSGWATTRFRVRGDGHSSYFASHGHEYTGEVVPFGESVLFKAPVSHSRQKRGGKRHHRQTVAGQKEFGLEKQRTMTSMWS
jgi:hypothetical protein